MKAGAEIIHDAGVGFMIYRRQRQAAVQA